MWTGVLLGIGLVVFVVGAGTVVALLEAKQEEDERRLARAFADCERAADEAERRQDIAELRAWFHEVREPHRIPSARPSKLCPLVAFDLADQEVLEEAMQHMEDA